MYKVLLELDKFFLKYECGSNWPPPPLSPHGKTTFKKLNINNYLPIKIIQTSLMKKPFKNTFKFSNIGINKFIFLLRKGGCLFLYGWMGNV